jgi:hypothetical protein
MLINITMWHRVRDRSAQGQPGSARLPCAAWSKREQMMGGGPERSHGWILRDESPPRDGFFRRKGGSHTEAEARHCLSRKRSTPPGQIPSPAYICIQHPGRGTSTPISTFATAGDLPDQTPPGSGPLHFHWKFHLLGIQVRPIEVSSESAGRHVIGILRSERGSRPNYLFGISRARGTARRYT